MGFKTHKKLLRSIMKYLAGISVMTVLISVALFRFIPDQEVVFAASSGTLSTGVSWTLYDDGTLNISGTGKIPDYGELESPFYAIADKIKSVNIGNNITEIGDHAFFNCRRIESVYIPSDGDLKWIEVAAFSYCESLKYINLPDNLYEIDYEAFRYCSSLNNIILPSGLIFLQQGAFANCDALSNIYLECKDLNYHFYESAFYKTGSACEKRYAGYKTSISDIVSDTLVKNGFTVFSNETEYKLGENIRAIPYPDNTMFIFGHGSTYNYSSANKSPLYNQTSYKGVSISGGIDKIGDAVFQGCSGITNIYIPSMITALGDHAFEGCTGITNITIPKNTTAIGDNCFAGCSGLTEVNMTSDNKLITLGESAFADCSGLSKISLSKNVTTIGSRAFSGCTGLKEFYLSGSITDIPFECFAGCSNLNKIYLNEITSIQEGAFENCIGLKRITVPLSVTELGKKAFTGCTGLEWVIVNANITLLKADTFAGCSALNTVVIPESVTRIDAGAFSDCSALKTVVIPESVTTIDTGAFADCSSLEKITLPVKLESIGKKAFEGCSMLEELFLPAKLKSIEDSAFVGCSKLGLVTNLCESNQSVANNAFDDSGTKASYQKAYFIKNNTSFEASIKNNYSCIKPAVINNLGYNSNTNNYIKGFIFEDGRMIIHGTGIIDSSINSSDKALIKSCEILDGVTEVRGDFFAGCTELTEVSLADSITMMGYHIFYNCNSLTKVNIPAALTYISGGMFENCEKLTDITLPKKITEIGFGSFLNCKNLKNVTLSSNITAINSKAFQNCTKIESLIIPNTVKTISEGCFAGCSGLKSITLPENLTEIAEEAFKDCTGLEHISLPDSLTYIGEGVFSGCTGLVDITIPASVPSIYSNTFFNCTGLVNVVIKPIAGSINGNAFKNCLNLTTVTISPIATQIKAESFTNCPKLDIINIFGETYKVNYVQKNAFSGCSSTLHLEFFNSEGVPLTADELTQAYKNYKSCSDGDTNDYYWFGARIAPAHTITYIAYSSISTDTYNENTQVTLTKWYSKTGYNFCGWYVADGSDKLLKLNDIITMSKDIVLSACYEPKDLKTTDESTMDSKDGEINFTKKEQEYRMEGTKEYLPCSEGTTKGLQGGTYYVRLSAIPEKGFLAGKEVAVTVKASRKQKPPTNLDARDVSSFYACDGAILNTTSAMEFDVSSNSENYTRCSDGATEGLPDRDYYVRFAAVPEENLEASDAVCITVGASKLQLPPSDLVAKAVSKPGAADGEILKTSSSMEYKLKNTEDSYICCGENVTRGLKEGTYLVRMAAVSHSGGADASEPVEVTITAPVVRDSPTGLEGVSVSTIGAADGAIRNTKATMEYKRKGTYDIYEQCSEGITSGLKAGTYLVRYAANEDKNMLASEPAEVTVTTVAAPVVQDSPTGLEGVSVSAIGAADGAIRNTKVTMEYKQKDSAGNYQNCAEGITSGLKAGTYLVRYAANEDKNMLASEPAEVTITAPVIQDSPIGLEGVNVSAIGAADGAIRNTKATMEYKLKDSEGNYQSCAEGITSGLKAGTYLVRYAKNRYENMLASEPAEVTVTTVTAPVVQNSPTGLEGVNVSAIGAADGAIRNTKATMEYKLATAEGSYIGCTEGETTGLAAGTYNVRFKETEGYHASPAVEVTIANGNSNQNAPTGLTGVAPTTYNGTDGKITGTTAAMEYKLKDSEGNYQSCAEGITSGLKAGTYLVRYAANEDKNMLVSEPAEVTVTTVTAPVVQDSPTGLEGVSVSAIGAADGAIRNTKATMEYKLKDSEGNYQSCAEGITAGLKAGTYLVRYAANKDKNMLASLPVEVTIGSTVIKRYTVTGTVKYQTAGVVTGAAITMTVASGTAIGTVTTDNNGMFVISEVLEGTYEMVITKDTIFKTVTIKVESNNVSTIIEIEDPKPTTDPGTTNPGTTDPGTTDPGTTNPGTTDPGTTNPGTTDPGTTNPGTTDPGTTNPGTTNPGTTNPGTPVEPNTGNGEQGNTVVPTPLAPPTQNPVIEPTIVKKEELQVDIKLGDGKDNTVAIPLQRTIDSNGKTTDTATYQEAAAKETIQKLKADGKEVAIISLPNTNSENSETKVALPVKSLEVMADGKIGLDIETEKAIISIPKETLQLADKTSKDEVFFSISPLGSENDKTEVIERAQKESVVKAAIKDGIMTVVGTPMVIETNIPEADVDIILPIIAGDIPVETKARQQYLDKLAVFIEHSDGSMELVKGEIVEYKDNVPGIKFRVKKFSTFTILQADNLELKSSACNITKVKEPEKVKAEGKSLFLTVSNAKTKIKVNVTVSKAASWKLYSDKACKKEIKNKYLKLKVGTNKGYIKVIAEDSTAEVYTFTVKRKAKEAVK